VANGIQTAIITSGRSLFIAVSSSWVWLPDQDTPRKASANLTLTSKLQNGQSRVDPLQPHELIPEDWDVLLDQLASTP
jgi:hypothetical protein